MGSSAFFQVQSLSYFPYTFQKFNCYGVSTKFVHSKQTTKLRSFSFDAIVGVARGCGWQKIGACINLGAYYIVGIPSAYLFAFVLRVGGTVRFPASPK